MLFSKHPADDLLDRHPVGTGHRWRLLSSTPWNEPTIMSATVAGTTFRPTPSYTTLRDVTADGHAAVGVESVVAQPVMAGGVAVAGGGGFGGGAVGVAGGGAVQGAVRALLVVVLAELI